MTQQTGTGPEFAPGLSLLISLEKDTLKPTFRLRVRRKRMPFSPEMIRAFLRMLGP